MKVKEARKSLEGYASDGLYQVACKLYQAEIKSIISLRSHGKVPTLGVVESAIKQVNDWFRKVAEGLPWENPGVPGDIIKWEASRVWVKHGIEDPEVTRYKHRARREVVKGTPLPLLEALTSDALDAIGGMMVAKVQEDARRWSKLNDKRKEFAGQYGLRLCPFDVFERFCKHQKTYSMVEGLPTNVDDLVFVCTTSECVKIKEAKPSAGTES